MESPLSLISRSIVISPTSSECTTIFEPSTVSPCDSSIDQIMAAIETVASENDMYSSSVSSLQSENTNISSIFPEPISISRKTTQFTDKEYTGVEPSIVSRQTTIYTPIPIRTEITTDSTMLEPDHISRQTTEFSPTMKEHTLLTQPESARSSAYIVSPTMSLLWDETSDSLIDSPESTRPSTMSKSVTLPGTPETHYLPIETIPSDILQFTPISPIIPPIHRESTDESFSSGPTSIRPITQSTYLSSITPNNKSIEHLISCENNRNFIPIPNNKPLRSLPPSPITQPRMPHNQVDLSQSKLEQFSPMSSPQMKRVLKPLAHSSPIRKVMTPPIVVRKQFQSPISLQSLNHRPTYTDEDIDSSCGTPVPINHALVDLAPGMSRI